MKLDYSKMALRLAAIALMNLCLPDSGQARVYRFRDLGADAGATNWATGISNGGQVTGLSYAVGDFNSHAMLWDRGQTFDLGTGGGAFGSGAAVNSLGMVVGSAASGRATLWQNGSATDLGTLGGAHSYANGINNGGQVVGQSYIDSGNVMFHAALWQQGGVLDLGTLGGNFSAAYGINNRAQVVGAASVQDGSGQHAALWSGGGVIDLGTLGGNRSAANSISDNGIVVGQSDLLWQGTTVSHATMWQDGRILDLGGLAADQESMASAVNLAGQVVGYAFYSDRAAPHAMLWQNGIMLDLNQKLSAATRLEGWVLNSATGINDGGSIVGSAFNVQTGVNHAFLLTPAMATTPVPEPASAVMLALGLGLLFCLQRKRTQQRTTRGKAPTLAQWRQLLNGVCQHEPYQRLFFRFLPKRA
jgi:probable HAF family extracellular repeat protein